MRPNQPHFFCLLFLKAIDGDPSLINSIPVQIAMSYSLDFTIANIGRFNGIDALSLI